MLLKKELSLGEIKDLFEYCNKNSLEEKYNARVAMCIFNNVKNLITPYKQIIQGIYNEKNDPLYHEYMEKFHKLISKYVDRDEQGKPIEEDGEPKITEMIAEFTEANDKLEIEYKELFDKLKNKNEVNSTFLKQKVEVEINGLTYEEIKDDKLPGYILGIILE